MALTLSIVAFVLGCLAVLAVPYLKGFIGAWREDRPRKIATRQAGLVTLEALIDGLIPGRHHARAIVMSAATRAKIRTIRDANASILTTGTAEVTTLCGLPIKVEAMADDEISIETASGSRVHLMVR